MTQDVEVNGEESLRHLIGECKSELRERSLRIRVLVHTGTCGIASGSKQIKNHLVSYLGTLDEGADVIVLETGCCGACHLEPMITVIEPDGGRTLYGHLNEERVERIAREHLAGGRPVRDLAIDENDPYFSKQVKRVTRLLGAIDPYDIRDYLSYDGYVGLLKALKMRPVGVIDEIKSSGLRGRGGAGFPTGLKWSFAADSPGPEKYVICNADEGDPGAYMDRAIIEGNPHSVIEGLVIAAYAIGAHRGYVYTRAEYPLAVNILRNAIDQARRYGFLGEDILGIGFDFDLDVYLGAGAFVCGEETALIASIEGRRGNPRPKPPYPADRGLFGKPTNVNNVKTLSSVPLIMREGADWFSEVGTEKSKGTMIFSLTGSVNRTGLIEVPLGISLREVVFEIGGGVPGKREFKAVQLGGPSGGCIPLEHIDTPIDYKDIESLGAIMGSGGMIVMDETSCMPDIARFFMEFTKEESCGKCTPCRSGIPQMLRILESILDGNGRREDLETLQYLGRMIKECSLCGLGQTAPNPVLSTLRHFEDEYLELIEKQKAVRKRKVSVGDSWSFG